MVPRCIDITAVCEVGGMKEEGGEGEGGGKQEEESIHNSGEKCLLLHGRVNVLPKYIVGRNFITCSLNS